MRVRGRGSGRRWRWPGRRGYATSRGEVIPGLESVAAPVVRGDSSVAGAVAVVFLAGTADLDALGTMVVEAAAAVRLTLQ